MAGARTGLTRYFGADEIAEKCKGIVECWANILGTRGLEANGGIEATCFAVDVRRYEIICTALNLFICTKAHNTNCKEIHQVFLFLNRGQRVAVGREPVTRFAAKVSRYMRHDGYLRKAVRIHSAAVFLPRVLLEAPVEGS